MSLVKRVCVCQIERIYLFLSFFIQSIAPTRRAQVTARASTRRATATSAGWAADANDATRPSSGACPTAPATDDSTRSSGAATANPSGPAGTATSVSRGYCSGGIGVEIMRMGFINRAIAGLVPKPKT